MTAPAAAATKAKFPACLAEDKIYRHNKGSLIVFADGHAGWQPADRIFSGEKDWTGVSSPKKAPSSREH